MDGNVSGITLNLLRHIYDSLGLGVLIIKFLELWIFFHSAVESHRESLSAKWYEFGNPVSQSVRVAECSSDIANSPARHHGAEGPYLSDVVCAVFFSSVVYKF